MKMTAAIETTPPTSKQAHDDLMTEKAHVDKRGCSPLMLPSNTKAMSSMVGRSVYTVHSGKTIKNKCVLQLQLLYAILCWKVQL